MRTHGARQQRETVKRTPREQLKPVFEVRVFLIPDSADRRAKGLLMFYIKICSQALDTLGSTKWRVNKRVLNVIDRIWATGGRLGDLVDRSDVC